MSALRRALVHLPLDVPGAVLNVDVVMSPVRAAFRHLKRVEPYEFRISVPEEVVEALCGVSLARMAASQCFNFCLRLFTTS